MIIKSLLDNDLYKFSMMNAVMKLFPRAEVKYKFINRGNNIFPDMFADRLRTEVKKMENLSLTNDEFKYLEKNIPFFDNVFLKYLKGYNYDSSNIGIVQNKEDLIITINGLWVDTILWEVPLMAVISELYFKLTNADILSRKDRKANNDDKAFQFEMADVQYADFGTRRRYSYEIHDELIKDFTEYNLKPKHFIGTSNVHFAMKYNLKPIGTHAHEWFSFHAAKYGFKQANFMAMENWVNVYRGDLGIALPDTFTTKHFFDNSFDKKFSKLYDGIRHDSGDPFEFANRTIKHYEKMLIDPTSKTIVFSDGLNPDKAIKLRKHCNGKIKCSMGIGTNFTNDVGVKPLNIVIKMTQAKPEGENWIDTIKLSDNPGKHTGEEKMIGLAKQLLNIVY